MDITDIRKRIVVALFSDDGLMDTLVLKGGNALSLVHGITDRSSIDLDFSMASHFPDLNNASERIFLALRREFRAIGYEVIDKKFFPKPSSPTPDTPDWWGGYMVEFKLLRADLYELYKDDLDALRRNSEVLGPHQTRKYTIDISRHEFCQGKIEHSIDDYVVYAYSLEMIAVEKLRAICQQSSSYPQVSKKRPRARDFYDIHRIVVGSGIDLTAAENLELFRQIFDAKHVPLSLLAEIKDSYDFHAADWPAVETSISGDKNDFRYYFDSVVKIVSTLESLWIE